MLKCITKTETQCEKQRILSLIPDSWQIFQHANCVITLLIIDFLVTILPVISHKT